MAAAAALADAELTLADDEADIEPADIDTADDDTEARDAATFTLTGLTLR